MLVFAVVISRALKKNSATQACYQIVGLTFLVLLIVRGPVANAVNHYYSMKPFGQRVSQMVGEHPLMHLRKIREDLLFYIKPPLRIESPGRAVRILQENPEAFLILHSWEGKGMIAANPGFQVVLEIDAGKRRQFQLIKNIPD